jgi:Tfp pilus assembly protein PilN
MIQINLTTNKKPLDLSDVGGMDLSKINVKMVLIAIVLLYVPDILILPSFEEEKMIANQELAQLSEQQQKLAQEVSKLKEFDLQIQQLKRREQQLLEKLALVKTIISKKKNPWNILVYVAKNIPPEIWLTEILYEGDKIVFKGLSTDYTNQGLFLENLKKSIFFSENLSYSKTNTSNLDESLKKLAPFEVTATITRYE